MATPIVSGVVAIHLSRKPWLTPADIKATLINEAIHDVLVYDENIIPSSSWAITRNRLLQIQGKSTSNNVMLLASQCIW